MLNTEPALISGIQEGSTEKRCGLHQSPSSCQREHKSISGSIPVSSTAGNRGKKKNSYEMIMLNYVLFVTFNFVHFF